MILISTAATAFLNFRDDLGFAKSDELRLTTLDSALYAALDIIAFDLRMARQAPESMSGPLAIQHLGKTDRLTIRHNNYQNEYLIDNENRLIRQTESCRQRLADEIISLKAQKLGKETIVLTLTARPKGESLDGKADIVRSYSRVVTVNFSL
jgi:hypothetical protein